MKIESFSKKDLIKNAERFCDLYTKVFTAKMNKEILLQRYISNPFEDFLMFVAIEDDNIIANYSAVPVALIVGGEERKAALSLNTMVAPEYQRKGLGIILARELYTYMLEQNYDLIYGFPNCNAGRMFNEGLGWQTIYEIPTLKLSIRNREKIYHIGLKIEEDKFDNLTGNIFEDTIYVKMSEEYISWRFKNNKEKEYHSLSIDKDNWIIYQRYKDEINITEINCIDNKKACELIKLVINIGIEEGFRSVTTWYKTNTKMHSRLEMMGFEITSPVRIFSAKCFNKSMTDTIYDYRNWRIQMGDDNVY